MIGTYNELIEALHVADRETTELEKFVAERVEKNSWYVKDSAERLAETQLEAAEDFIVNKYNNCFANGDLWSEQNASDTCANYGTNEDELVGKVIFAETNYKEV